MAKFVWQSVRFFVAGADLTSVNNKLEVSTEREVKEATAFTTSGAPWAEVLAGIATTEISGEGQWEATDTSKVDDVAFAGLGSITAVTMCPAGAADGATAYLTGALSTSYTLGAAVGDVAPWTAEMKGNWPLARGMVLNPPGTARTATGTGTAFQLGAVSATQKLYATLHVVSVSGTTPSMTVKVQSDNAQGFPSATDRLTFTAATARTSELLRTDGAITDDWFRVSYTISGTSPSFLALVAVGVA